MSSRPILLVLCALFLSATGCEANRASWRFLFDTEELKLRANIIEARILAGGCGSDDVVYEALITPIIVGDPPDTLGEGTYGFAGRAGSNDCHWFAAGCSERTLPLEDGAVVEIWLRESESEPYCDDGICVLGRCTPEEEDADFIGDADSDDDDEIDADVDEDGSPEPPSIPQLLTPLNGWSTGSVHVLSSDLLSSPRRPNFRWKVAPGADYYEIQIDDSCSTPGFASCDFPSIVLAIESIETTFQPAFNLDVSEDIPVGRRYYWRVRACNDAGCSDWSPVRYVDIARLFNDFNGDGYSDIAISAPNYANSMSADEIGAVFAFQGNAEGNLDFTNRLESSTPVDSGGFGFSVAVAGDVNSDGFADLVVGSSGNDVVALFYGSIGGLSQENSTFVNGTSGSRFGGRVASAGDIDADGFADILVGAPWADDPNGSAFLYKGSSDGIIAEPLVSLDNPNPGGRFGYYLATAGDVNGDGYSDIIIGAFANTPGGEVFLYYGNTSGITETPSLTLSNPLGDASGDFGIVVSAAGDTNGDGYSDIIVGDYLRTSTYDEEGVAFVFQGSPSGLSRDVSAVLRSPHAEEFGNFGWRIASAGDYDHDGYDDVLVGATGEDSTVEDSGRAYLFRGTPSGLAEAPSRIFDNPDETQVDAGFGLSLANGGDINGDGFTDIFIGAPGHNHFRGQVFLFFSGSTGFPTSPSVTVDSPDPQVSSSFGFSLETGLGP